MSFAIGLLLLAASFCVAQSTEQRQEFHRTFSNIGQRSVTIRNTFGNVTIMAWDKPDVQVDGVKHADTSGKMESAQIVVEQRPDTVCIAVKYADARKQLKEWFGFPLDICADQQNIRGDVHEHASVDFTIHVPRGAMLDAKLICGDADVEGVGGTTRVHSITGSVSARGIGGRAQLSSILKNVDAEFPEFRNEAELSSVQGSVRVKLGEHVSAVVEMSSPAGYLHNDFGWFVSKPERRVRGQIGSGGPRLVAKSITGTVDIRRMAPLVRPASKSKAKSAIEKKN